MTKDERREYFRKWRRAHPDYWRNKTYYKEYYSAWRKTHPDYKAERMKARPEERFKVSARQKLNYAVKKGVVKKKPCKKCGDINSHGHHPDYNKPLVVVWLCRTHHGEIHRKF